MKKIVTLLSLLLLPLWFGCGAADPAPGIGHIDNALTVACGAPTPYCPDVPSCHITDTCPPLCKCAEPQGGQKACPYFRIYCPPECFYDNSCPGKCHCNNGGEGYTLCGPLHCGANDVCCTGPIVNGQPNYQCQPQGTFCPL